MQEKIKQLQEKHQRMVEEMERQKKKEQEERERLRREILEQAAKAREEKQKQLEQQQGDSGTKLPELKKRAVSKKEQELASVYGKQTEPQPPNVEKEKMNNYFRGRYASFLASLQENLKAKKATEEAEKKRKEDILNKIRESMGIHNVTSKLFDAEKNKENNLPKPDSAANRGRVSSSQDPEGHNTGESPQGKLTPEAQQKLLDKHKKLLAQIAEKKKLEQQQEEEELQRRERVNFLL